MNIPVIESKALLKVELSSLKATFSEISQNGIKNKKIYTLKIAEEIIFNVISNGELLLIDAS